MDILLMLGAIVAAVHAFMYGRWLFKNGQKGGAFVVYFLVLISIILPIYKTMSAQ